jgi:thiamine-phosphate pyrophosphorylase
VILCLVTDRHRLHGGEPGRASEELLRELAHQIGEAADAGIDLVQIRERDLEARDLACLVTAAIAQIRGTPMRVIVNDRLDVALACGAHGVHLRGDSISASDVRRVAPTGFWVGRSVHTLGEAETAGPVDYLIAGSIFQTASKPADHPLLGPDGLHRIATAVAVPVLAIGGVTLANVGEVAAAGAAGVSAIGMFASGPLLPTVGELRAKFDSVRSASYHSHGLR